LWSPDGDRLAVPYRKLGGGADAAQHLLIVSIDSKKSQLIGLEQGVWWPVEWRGDWISLNRSSVAGEIWVVDISRPEPLLVHQYIDGPPVGFESALGSDGSITIAGDGSGGCAQGLVRFEVDADGLGVVTAPLALDPSWAAFMPLLSPDESHLYYFRVPAESFDAAACASGGPPSDTAGQLVRADPDGTDPVVVYDAYFLPWRWVDARGWSRQQEAS
jgi:hypothetical protein